MAAFSDLIARLLRRDVPQAVAVERPPTPWERGERLAVVLLPLIVVMTLGGTAFMLIVPDAGRGIRADEKLLVVGLATLFAAMAVIFLLRLINSLESGDTLGIESHWGGLGGGVGGWRISNAAVYLICTAAFTALAVVVLANYRGTGGKTQQQQTSAATTTTGTANQSQASGGQK